MIAMEKYHDKIVKDILIKYPYTFYAFGSRIKNTSKKLSDLDLCFFENIPWHIRYLIDEDFERSDLPFQVDVVDWHMCDQEFREMILKDLVCIQANALLLKIEKIFFDYLVYLPKKLKFNVIETSELTLVNYMLNANMFNIVCNTNIQKTNFSDIKSFILKAIVPFKEQSFAWWLGPSTIPNNIKYVLHDLGFIMTTTQYVMICNLNQLDVTKNIQANLNIKLMQNSRGLQDFITILESFEITGKAFFENINIDLESIDAQKFFIGYEQNSPVVIGMLYLQEGLAGIFTLSTKENKRCRGYGTYILQYMLNYAKQKGCNYAALTVPYDVSVKTYQRLGLQTVGLLECYEWQSIHNDH